MFQRWWFGAGGRKAKQAQREQARRRARRKLFAGESLESRRNFACDAFYDAGNQLLTILGTAGSELCEISHDDSGNILLDGNLTGATLNNTNVISVATGDSNDAIRIDMRNGLFVKPGGDEIKILLDGGAGEHDLLYIHATNQNDRVDIGAIGGVPQFNFNGDGDVDLVGGGMDEFYVMGERGDDVLSGAGNDVVGSAFPYGL